MATKFWHICWRRLQKLISWLAICRGHLGHSKLNLKICPGWKTFFWSIWFAWKIRLWGSEALRDSGSEPPGQWMRLFDVKIKRWLPWFCEEDDEPDNEVYRSEASTTSSQSEIILKAKTLWRRIARLMPVSEHMVQHYLVMINYFGLSMALNWDQFLILQLTWQQLWQQQQQQLQRLRNQYQAKRTKQIVSFVVL